MAIWVGRKKVAGGFSVASIISSIESKISKITGGGVGNLVKMTEAGEVADTGVSVETILEQLSPTLSKDTITDADTMVVTDSTDDSKKKSLSWEKVLSVLNTIFAPLTHSHEMSEVAGLDTSMATTKANMATLAGRSQLTSGKDLNTVTIYGNYASSSSGVTNTLINKPSDLYGYFELDVTSSDGMSGSGYLRQTIRASAPYYAGRQWIRTFAPSEGWSGWREIPTTRSGTLTLVNGWQARNGYTPTVTLIGQTVSVNALVHGGVNSELTQMAQVGDSTFYPSETRFVECGNGSAVHVTPTGKIDIGVPFKADITSCRLCLSYIL